MGCAKRVRNFEGPCDRKFGIGKTERSAKYFLKIAHSFHVVTKKGSSRKMKNEGVILAHWSPRIGNFAKKDEYCWRRKLRTNSRKVGNGVGIHEKETLVGNLANLIGMPLDPGVVQGRRTRRGGEKKEETRKDDGTMRMFELGCYIKLKGLPLLRGSDVARLRSIAKDEPGISKDTRAFRNLLPTNPMDTIADSIC
ncbi:hypothetical protein WN48_10742 [Eufriesea mexicana]|uniref:Uncharacterized protein n=1 Tax=Eufriesea mexicana TaxID=516756 RepID=A0A310SCT6_9HYME|nr:hypothetical protein WN48_10742 [Eufriesea mexicana]